MTQAKTILLAIISGLIIAFIGEFLMGYLAAIAVPSEYFIWFRDSFFKGAGLLLLDVFNQFIAFGLLGIIAGITIGRKAPSSWFKTSAICYLVILLYFTIRMGSFPLPYGSSGVPWWLYLSMGVLPLCITMASRFAANQYNHGVK